mgnify:FL=1
MQLTSTTDYAIRIVCYLAAQRQMISTSELSQELSVPSSYIPKITILLSLQNTYNNKLESVKVSDVIRPGEDEYFGRFYVVLKLNLKEKSYECVYSHIREVYEKVRKTKSYEEFINQYIERYVYASDKKMVHGFLSSEGLEERMVDAYDALINDRPYKRKYEPEEAIRMISNGECGAFSNQLMQCFQEAAKQQNWLKRQN